MFSVVILSILILHPILINFIFSTSAGESYIDEIVSNSTKRITRIINDRNCLCYFVQYLEQKSALPLIRFWLEVESFKSSAEQCGHHQHEPNLSRLMSKRLTPKPAIGRSVSLDGIALNRNDFYNAFHQQSHDDDTPLDADGKCTDFDPNSTLSSSNELPPERDNGDGSSDANSMTNLSDIYERNDDDQLDDAISMDNEYGNTVGGVQKIFENGRKSATGASSHDGGGGADDSECDAKSGTTTSKFATSMTIDAIRIFQKYLLDGELTRLVHIPTTILSQISLVLCCRPNDDNSSDRINHQPSTPSKLSISNESLALSTADGAIEEKMLTTVFDDAQTYILDHLDQIYCAEFLESPFYYRFCLENTGTNLTITDILYNELALFYFMEFLEIEQNREYLDFWLAAMNYKRQLVAPRVTMVDDKETLPNEDDDDDDDYDTTAVVERNVIEQCQNDALILYEKYFSLQATCSLHLSDRIRFHIEEKICTIDHAADAIAHCFDLPLAVIERFLSVRYLKMFEQSTLFYKYLAELRQKMDAMSTKPATNKATVIATSTHNDSDEHHKHNKHRSAQNRPISAKNTLLAMESVKKRTNSQKNLKSSDMCIDARQLHDPDLLWRRTSTPGGLKFGRVNALGRYERDYDMTPCDKATTTYMRLGGSGGHATTVATGTMDANQILQTTSDKIKRAVRKLVHLPEQNMQEELAWQMAEMIVKDITSVTLQTNQVPAKETV